MDDPKGIPEDTTPLAEPSEQRHARVPNMSGFWTDLALATCAFRSSSIELRAACLHAMRCRVDNDVDSPGTKWDDMLVGMGWLREDFKCEAERKRTFLRNAAKECTLTAGAWIQRMRSRYAEAGSYQTLESGSTIPEWARNEYLAQIAQPQDMVLDVSSHSREASRLELNRASSTAAEYETWKGSTKSADPRVTLPS